MNCIDLPLFSHSRRSSFRSHSPQFERCLSLSLERQTLLGPFDTFGDEKQLLSCPHQIGMSQISFILFHFFLILVQRIPFTRTMTISITTNDSALPNVSVCFTLVSLIQLIRPQFDCMHLTMMMMMIEISV
jgi:hypothetical protein